MENEKNRKTGFLKQALNHFYLLLRDFLKTVESNARIINLNYGCIPQ